MLDDCKYIYLQIGGKSETFEVSDYHENFERLL